MDILSVFTYLYFEMVCIMILGHLKIRNVQQLYWKTATDGSTDSLNARLGMWKNLCSVRNPTHLTLAKNNFVLFYMKMKEYHMKRQNIMNVKVSRSPGVTREPVA